MAGKPRSDDLLRQMIPPPQKLTDEQIGAARLVVCSHADDASEAGTLLSMLGLL